MDLFIHQDSMGQDVSQQMIADRLGISRATVSRCFTNHPGINPVTRAKVFSLAAELGYQHMEMRATTRPEKSKSSKKASIGVLICTEIEEYLRNDYESPGVELYAGVSEFAQLHQQKIEMHYVNPREKTITSPSYAAIEGIRSRRWSGVILIYPFPRDVVQTLHVRMPTVSLVEQYGTAPFNCVDVDHYKGIALLLDRLVAMGHRRIGFFTRTYEVEGNWPLRRYAAFLEKMTRLKIGVNPKDLVNVRLDRSLTNDEGHAEAEARTRDGVTAWVCTADHQAYDLIAHLERCKFRVPKDVSVTGFDGITPPKGSPTLTTAVVPYREIGLTGCRRLQDLSRKRFGSAQHTLVSCAIRDGATVAPPRSLG